MNPLLAEYRALCLRIKYLGELCCVQLGDVTECKSFSITKTKIPLVEDETYRVEIDIADASCRLKLAYFLAGDAWKLTRVAQTRQITFELNFYNCFVLPSLDIPRVVEQMYYPQEKLRAVSDVLESVVTAKESTPEADLNVWHIVPTDDAERIATEIVESHQNLEPMLTELDSLCYPYGHTAYNPYTIPLAVTVRRGYATKESILAYIK